MKKHIQLQQKNIQYTLKMSLKARRMRLAIYYNGDFVVTAPRGTGETAVEQFIIRKAQWVVDKLQYFKPSSGIIFVKNNRKDFVMYKESALTLAKQRVQYFSSVYGFKVNKVNIKNQKTLWGSCSKKGNLNFSYKIALLPERLADYIIVHEVCHLGEFNHSQKFWDLVAQTIPEYREIKDQLKKKGMELSNTISN